VAGDETAGECVPAEDGAGAAGVWEACMASFRLMRFLRFMEMDLLRLTWGNLDEPVIHGCARICQTENDEEQA
jgi:hypothetical protein